MRRAALCCECVRTWSTFIPADAACCCAAVLAALPATVPALLLVALLVLLLAEVNARATASNSAESITPSLLLSQQSKQRSRVCSRRLISSALKDGVPLIRTTDGGRYRRSRTSSATADDRWSRAGRVGCNDEVVI